jgi:hypothetical protein
MTSIEWFNEKIIELDIDFDCELINKEQYWIKRNKLVEQAKEKHKIDIMNSIEWANRKGYDEHILTCINDDDEKYYKEIFKKD